MNDKGVYRIAPATPGLLNMYYKFAFYSLCCFVANLLRTSQFWIVQIFGLLAEARLKFILNSGKGIIIRMFLDILS